MTPRGQTSGTFNWSSYSELKASQGKIEAVSRANFQPDDVPAILSEPAAVSATPRLDALLGEAN